MDAIFINSENSRTLMPHILTLKLANRLDLRFGENIIALSNLSIYYNKYKKAHTIIINLKYLHQHGMMNLNYQIDLILYQIFKIILNIY